MNRFEYVNAKLLPEEAFVSKDRNVKLYDGDEKVSSFLKMYPFSDMVFNYVIIGIISNYRRILRMAN